jgi:DNA-binding GntR family transcriptional regulator
MFVIALERLIMIKYDSEADAFGSGGTLVKEHLARWLKEAISTGRLAPGERVIEGKWAREFGVAQASVREAINLLVSEGFLIKDSGRSARVVRYVKEDLPRVFEVRAVLEGLAARLVAQQQPDLARMENALEAMMAAAKVRDMKTLIENDMAFHMSLCELSANPHLIEAARRVMVPLFAFQQFRSLASGNGPEKWIESFPRHRRLIDIIRDGDASVAEQYTRLTITHFASTGRGWEIMEQSAEPRRVVRQRERPVPLPVE